MQKGYYRFDRVYVSEKGEGDFYDVLPEKLALNKVSWYKVAQPRGKTETMFKEVNIKPYKKDESFVKRIKSITPRSDKNWKETVWNCLKQIVYEHWQPERFHVIAHSGGVDSRILSSIIKELYEENGKDWLGDILFVENGGEADTFKAIMKYQKWPKKYQHVYNDHKPPDMFHQEALEFDYIRERYNGVSSYPFNLFYECYDQLIKRGVIPENFQGFAGFGPYIDIAFRMTGIDNWLEWDYYYQFRSFRKRGDWFFPWWDYRYIYLLASLMPVLGLGRIRVSDAINPIPSIPNVPYCDIVHGGYRHVNKGIMDDVMYRYFLSWYGQNIDTTPDDEIRYSDWWGQYCEASICEYLIDKGHKICIV